MLFSSIFDRLRRPDRRSRPRVRWFWAYSIEYLAIWRSPDELDMVPRSVRLVTRRKHGWLALERLLQAAERKAENISPAAIGVRGLPYTLDVEVRILGVSRTRVYRQEPPDVDRRDRQNSEPIARQWPR